MDKFKELGKNLQEVVIWLQKEFKQISAGVANPAVLDNVKIDAYGTSMPIAHLASISLDANTLRVLPFDKTQLKVVEQAIREADLGVSLIIESDGVRVIFPQLTAETRTKYVKLAKEKLEEARIKVRQFRAEINTDLDAEKLAGNMSEDDNKRKKGEVQKLVDSTNNELESLFKQKEETILKI